MTSAVDSSGNITTPVAPTVMYFPYSASPPADEDRRCWSDDEGFYCRQADSDIVNLAEAGDAEKGLL